MTGEHVHLDVVLTVSCCDHSQVPVVAEKLSRMLAGLALDGYEANLNIWRFTGVDEDEEQSL